MLGGAEPMKPDWKDAPEWAGYLCHDLDGMWVWFTSRPRLTAAGMWYGGSFSNASQQPEYGDISIEPRPCKTT